MKPYVKTNKSDYIDAEAIAEDVARRTMRFVPIKADDQLDLQPLHRVMFGIISSMTESERSLVRERVKAGMRNAKARGHLPGKKRMILDLTNNSSTHRVRRIS